MYLKAEKDSLHQLPPDTIRNPYQLIDHKATVDNSSLFRYKGNQYSVPPEYIGQKVTLQVYDDYIHVYCNTKLIALHAVSDKKINHTDKDYISLARQTHSFSEKNLETFRLGQMALHLQEVADRVSSENLSFSEGLLKLSNYEVDFKESSSSNSTIKAAAFPFVKTLNDFDFDFQPTVSEKQMQEFCSLGFMEHAENVVFLGNSGGLNHKFYVMADS